MSKKQKPVSGPIAKRPIDMSTIDLRQSLKVDLTACIALLGMISESPEIQDAVLKKLEDFRQDSLKNQGETKPE